MAEPKSAIYEVNSVIEFKYRCNGDPATASPVCEVLDEAGVIDAQSPVTLIQIGTTRLFSGNREKNILVDMQRHRMRSRKTEMLKKIQKDLDLIKEKLEIK